MVSSIDKALQILTPDGYTLWVGAGVSLHATTGAGQRPLLWSALTNHLEQKAAVAPPKTASFPDRLDVCLSRLGRFPFQKILRESVLIPCAEGIIETAIASPKIVPQQIQQIAKLGWFANPIVNFNVEHFTSFLLAAPAGPFAARTFQPRVIGAVRDAFRIEFPDQSDGFRRIIYHPHGTLQSGGICVMTSSEYRSMRGTLALQLAAHAAFGRVLVIVGMSLADTYLRKQLTNFREQVMDIVWFASPPDLKSKAIGSWAWKNNVRIVEVLDWHDFWASIDKYFHPSWTDLQLMCAWHNTIVNALIMQETPKSTYASNIGQHAKPPAWLSAQYTQMAVNSGEDPNRSSRYVYHRDAPGILSELRNEIRSKGGRIVEELARTS